MTMTQGGTRTRDLANGVHLMSTRRHSRDTCSQVFPVFHHSSASVYYTECKPMNKKGGGLGTRLQCYIQFIC